MKLAEDYRRFKRRLIKSKPSETLIIAHRGMTGEHLDNSPEAFSKAIKQGIPAAELDVRRTKDKALIIYHDKELGGKKVSSLKHKEIEDLLGFRPPLLREVLELAKGKIKLNVEIKEDGYEEEIVAILRNFEKDDLIVSSFIDGVVQKVKKLWPEVKTGLLISRFNGQTKVGKVLSTLFPVKRAERCRADFLILHSSTMKAGTISRSAKAEIPVIVWTVNRDEGVERLLCDSRVVGIITDHPDRAIEIQNRLNKPAKRFWDRQKDNYKVWKTSKKS